MEERLDSGRTALSPCCLGAEDAEVRSRIKGSGESGPFREKGRRNRPWVGTKWEQLLGSRVLPCPLVSSREVNDVQGFPAGTEMPT